MVSLYDEYRQMPMEKMLDASESSIFSLRRLEWSKAAGQESHRELRKVVVGNNVLIAATVAGTILRRNLDAPNGGLDEEIEISRRREDSIEHIFIDPTGNHTIIAVSSGENFYLHSKSQRPKKFSSKIQGNILSVAFDRLHGTESSTKSLLVGTSAGCVYEISIDSSGKEKLCQLVYTLDAQQPMPITSIHFDLMKMGTVGAGAGMETDVCSTLVLLATSQPTRLYYFCGPAESSFQQLFARYVNISVPNYTQLPGDITRPQLVCFRAKNAQPSPPSLAFALMTKEGIYHGSALVKLNNGAKSLLVMEDPVAIEADLLPYGDTAAGGFDDPPLSIAPSDFHFLSLHYDKLLCISRLNGDLAQEESLRVADGNAIGLVRDAARGTLWLYTDAYVFNISVLNEDKNTWAIYLSKALAGDSRLFDVAYAHCKRKEDQAKVMNARAEFALRTGLTEQAAAFFAKSGAAFEDVVLRLLSTHTHSSGGLQGNEGESNKLSLLAASTSKHYAVTDGPELSAMRTYLLNEIQMLPVSAKSQRTMICTWLSEIYLHQITMAGLAREASSKVGSGAGGLTAARGAGGATEDELVSQFKTFMREMRLHLDPATTLNLITSRGRTVHRDLLLAYVRNIGDYDRVVGHLITERQYLHALKVLSEASLDRSEELIYKFAPVLIQFQPESTVDMLLTKKKLRVSGVLPALLRYASLLDSQLQSGSGASVHATLVSFPLDVDRAGNKANFAIRYLQGSVAAAHAREGPLEVIVLHTLLWFLAKYDAVDEQQLCAYLERLITMKQEGFLTPPLKVNYEYMVRQCKLFKRRRGAVYAYFLIGMDYEAVDAALKVDISLAKKVAQNPKDPAQKKRLWLIIAQHIIRTDSDAKRALLLIKESDESLKIEDLLPLLPDFTEIELFKEDICGTLEECSLRIDNLKSEMEELSESAEGINTELESMKKRGYSVSSLQRCEYCMSALFSRGFYLFPCSHGFHNDCLLSRVHSHKHLSEPQLEAVKLLDEQIRSISNRAKDDKRAMAQLEYLQNELDGFVAADCPLCGYVMIRSLAVPLISSDDEAESKTWAL